MTRREAVSKLMHTISVVDTGVIAALMLAQPEDWEEVTTPAIGDHVVIYEGDEEIEGDVHQLAYDTKNKKTSYGIDIGEEEDLWVDSKSDVFDVVFGEVLPNCNNMFSGRMISGDLISDEWYEDGGIEILSKIGFRVFKSEQFGYFFGLADCENDADILEECFDMLYDELGLQWCSQKRGECHYCGRTRDEIQLAHSEHLGLLVCDACGESYCMDCLKNNVSSNALAEMVWYGDTLLCPICAKKKGYK